MMQTQNHTNRTPKQISSPLPFSLSGKKWAIRLRILRHPDQTTMNRRTYLEIAKSSSPLCQAHPHSINSNPSWPYRSNHSYPRQRDPEPYHPSYKTVQAKGQPAIPWGRQTSCSLKQTSVSLSYLYYIEKITAQFPNGNCAAFIGKNLRFYYSPNSISRIWTAAFDTEVPGPKMAATPALYRKS